MLSFKVALFATILGVSLAGLLGGHSHTYRKQDPWGYNFGYDIVDHKGAKNGREESGDGHGNVKGSYNIKDIDGRVRVVHYVADKGGFRATIDTNEPGTAKSQPAAAIYNAPHAQQAHAHNAHAQPAHAQSVLIPVSAPISYGYGIPHGHYGGHHGGHYGGHYGHGY